jgi:hypothetical protein
MRVRRLELVAGVIFAHDPLLFGLFIFGVRVGHVGMGLCGQVLAGVVALKTDPRFA